MHIVVMGVTASGKTTVARSLAHRFTWEFADADDFHSAASVSKMRSGRPLDDSDRGPWLASLTQWIADHDHEGRSTVLACSALRRAYRDRLRQAAPEVVFAYLRGSFALISRRMAGRTDHFMPTALLRSQFDTLEEPTPEEGALVVDAAEQPSRIVEQVAAHWMIQRASPR
jgi:carbohydrate kinase (thermoresistant glucokinase family)